VKFYLIMTLFLFVTRIRFSIVVRIRFTIATIIHFTFSVSIYLLYICKFVYLKHKLN
jgi:hypothetical protein